MVEIPGQNIQVGPFIGGLNTFSDDTSVADNELPVCENFELDLDGSLKSRPSFRDLGVYFPLGSTGNINVLGYYYAPDGTPSLLASDGLTRTYRFDGTAWVLITDTFAATAMAQFDGKAYMTAPQSSANPGGYWSPSTGFVADANMPKGDIIVAHKFRLWVAPGKNAPTDGTRLYRSDVLGSTPLWPVSPAFIDVGAGDGQSIVQVLVSYNTLLIFRTRSIYNFQFTTDPAQGVVSLIVPGIGLSDAKAVVPFEAYIYFMYEDRAYEFVNNRATQVNVKVPFKAVSEAGIYAPFVVSEFNRRIIFSYYDTMYVFGLKTRTWTVWRSPQRGAIGKIIARETGDSTPEAIAHSSAAVGPAGTVRTNYAANPCIGGTLTGLAGGRCTLSDGGSYIRGTVTDALAANLAQLITPAPADASNYAPVVPGNTMTISAEGRSSISITLSVVIQYFDSAFAYISGSQTAGAATATNASTFTALSPVTSTAPAGAAYARWFVAIAGTSPRPIDTTFDARNVLFEKNSPSTADQFFSGASPDTALNDHAWSGTVGSSFSTQTRLRAAATLFLADDDLSGEMFTCKLQTKNFNYQASSNYKRLFWWGVDALFQGEVTGTVTPVVYGSSVQWGQLRTGSKTWGSLLNFSWGQPQDGSISVTDTQSTVGTTLGRKFIKFPKSLRFRQAYFTLEFPTDGTLVRVFSLSTFVLPKERVSSTIT